jgi:hypothetical protein
MSFVRLCVFLEPFENLLSLCAPHFHRLSVKPERAVARLPLWLWAWIRHR